ncbi:HEAT repeat domain-containing protein [Nodularia spumigena]|uniref:HEAT repeat domain-containing protein n=1 Tax=Nodularia spumigena UHCC 0060 TaxID=3110300 RepID=A0ABU5UM72_NODSP|nr:HEAT repeat domain-containing protein [Nodularia spumigena]MEA5523451.1 HEAT repeat domain-containing protein [Nodularia spumigena UHCC 0143]MEA5607370.1 HEAT repeat domain-containing protein [Nodularia spumigena UHCC 0060]MEA5611158.1 HEAT repeat domain-containing protein [Nodularia spumigena UHCC 0040]
MTITININTDESITLEEYVEYISSTIDLSDTEQVINSATALKALSNNRSFLVEKINQELLNWDNFQTENSYSAQTLALGGKDGFFVRANIWTPATKSKSPGESEWEKKLFAYELPHDHNFSFLTVGYLGSGYETTIYEYEPTTVIGYEGEPVDLTFLERTSLPRGKVMYYRASRDIHTQEPPIELSISINLLIVSPEANTSNQYCFDIESATIKGFVQNPGTGRIMLCHLARHVGDGSTINILEALAKNHEQPRLRWTAYESLVTLNPTAKAEILEQAVNDSHSFVQMYARKALGTL